MSFEEFRDGGHLAYPNETILAILNPCVTVMLPIVLAQFSLRFGRRRRLKNFKMAGHLGHQNGKFLAILNLTVAPMSPIKFRLNLTYGLGEDVV